MPHLPNSSQTLSIQGPSQPDPKLPLSLCVTLGIQQCLLKQFLCPQDPFTHWIKFYNLWVPPPSTFSLPSHPAQGSSSKCCLRMLITGQSQLCPAVLDFLAQPAYTFL